MALKKIPTSVQLPGGVKLKAVPFRVVEYDAEWRPIKFAIIPAGTPIDPNERGVWWLYASEEQIRSPAPENLR